VTSFLILGQAACWDTVERDDLLGLVHSRKVVLSSGMLAAGFIMAVAVHSASSFAVVGGRCN
jgi:hypothetical protein